jgi:hypothetical protein
MGYFDQIMVSTLLQTDYSSFDIGKQEFTTSLFDTKNSGQYKGYPLRHSTTRNGFSDHFPVYIYLIRKK